MSAHNHTYNFSSILNKKVRYKGAWPGDSHARLSINYHSVNSWQTTCAISMTFSDKNCFFLVLNPLLKETSYIGIFLTLILRYYEVLKPFEFGGRLALQCSTITRV